MRASCERCGVALPPEGDARICSYECTFCPACTGRLSGQCPNCGGELLPRPRRIAAGEPAAGQPGTGPSADGARNGPGTLPP